MFIYMTKIEPFNYLTSKSQCFTIFKFELITEINVFEWLILLISVNSYNVAVSKLISDVYATAKP